MHRSGWTRSEHEGAQGMGRFPLDLPTPILHLDPNPTEAASVDEAGEGDGATGETEAAAGHSTRTGIVTDTDPDLGLALRMGASGTGTGMIEIVKVRDLWTATSGHVILGMIVRLASVTCA